MFTFFTLLLLSLQWVQFCGTVHFTLYIFHTFKAFCCFGNHRNKILTHAICLVSRVLLSSFHFSLFFQIFFSFLSSKQFVCRMWIHTHTHTCTTKETENEKCGKKGEKKNEKSRRFRRVVLETLTALLLQHNAQIQIVTKNFSFSAQLLKKDDNFYCY